MDHDPERPDIAAMCREAGVPSDDPAARRLVELVARHCVGVCERMLPDGEIDHLEPRTVRAVGGDAAKLTALYQLG